MSIGSEWTLSGGFYHPLSALLLLTVIDFSLHASLSLNQIVHVLSLLRSRSHDFRLPSLHCPLPSRALLLSALILYQNVAVVRPQKDFARGWKVRPKFSTFTCLLILIMHATVKLNLNYERGVQESGYFRHFYK